MLACNEAYVLSVVQCRGWLHLHLVAGRIEFRRGGHDDAWSDLLLAPMTHGRENERYSPDGGYVLGSGAGCLADRLDTCDAGSRAGARTPKC